MQEGKIYSFKRVTVPWDTSDSVFTMKSQRKDSVCVQLVYLYHQFRRLLTNFENVDIRTAFVGKDIVETSLTFLIPYYDVLLF